MLTKRTDGNLDLAAGEGAPHPSRGCEGGASRYEAGIPVRFGFPLRFRRRSASGKGRVIPCIKFPILSLIGIVWPDGKTFRKIFRTISNSLSFGLREVARSLRGIARPAYSWRMQPRGRLFISGTERRNDFRSIRTIVLTVRSRS